MKVRTRKLVAICLMFIFVLFACAALITAFNSLTANAAFAGYGAELSDEELYSNSNTYNVSDIGDNEVTYNFNSPNGKTVMEEPQITVLTPGLGGTAAHWSNAYPDVHKNEKGEDVTYFAYSEDSIIHQLYMKAGGDAYVYWAKMYNAENFNLYDIIKVDDETYKEDYEKYEDNLTEVVQIEDVSKPIIIVFESSNPVGGNDEVYYELNYMLSKVVYDVSLHNPGKALPKVNLIGHSRGGITNLQYALDHPDLVDKLISLGTPYLGSEESLAFGEMILGWSEGLEDINTLSLTDGYLERWNSNYEWLYSDIDVTAIGAISSILFISDMLGEEVGGVLGDALDLLVHALLGTVVGRLLLDGVAWKGTKVYAAVEMVIPEIEEFFFYEQLGYVWDILLTHIDGIIYPMWLGDILVPVDSAVGNKDGKTYKGFNRIVGTFDKNDGTDLNKRCVANVPVPHNLITMDQRFIDLVLNEISFDDAVVSEFSYTEKQDGTIKIDRYYGVKNREFVIPSEIDGKTVSEISSTAFAYAFLEGTVTETIRIPATVTEIGDYAFLNNSGLKQVVFESGSQLIRVGHSAFSGCSGLTSVALPAGVEEIGSMAFADCSSLTGTFTLPTAMTDYGACAFVGCDGLTAFALSASNSNYSVANGVLYDEDKTSLYCYPAGKSGSSFVVPDTVTTISEYAFYGNESLSSVDLANITTIREKAFADCENLDTVLSEKADIIEGFAFAGTEWYESNEDFAVIGNVVYSCLGEETDVDFGGYFSVSPYAALGNSNIETITFNNAARNIGAFAFAGCENLDTVYLNNLNNIIYVGTDALEGTADHLTIYVPQRILDEYEENDLWQQYADSFVVHTTSVNYNLNGGNINGQTDFTTTVEYGGYVSLPEPVRTGYTFEGWYEAEDLSGQKLDANSLWTSYAADGNLYAKWAPLNYTIEYNLNGGSMGSPTIQTYTIEDAVQFAVPQMEGYTFAGWYTDEGLTKPAGDSFAAGRTGDITLYAKWEPNEYTVTYNYNLNTGETLQGSYPANTTVTYGRKYSMAVPERFGYEFNGWRDAEGAFYSNEDGTATFNSWNVAEDITLYADWTLVYYQLQIDDRGVIYWVKPDGSISKVESQIPGNVTLSLLDIIENFRKTARNLKVGHKFAYFIDESGNEITSWSKYLTEIQTGGTISFEAYYEKEQNFTIDFISYPTDPGSNPFVGEYDTAIRYLTVSKEGYTLKYWKVADVAENDIYVGTSLAPGTIFDYSRMPDLSINKEADGEHIYLEAYFEPNEYTISLYSDYGNLSPSKVSVKYDSKVALPVLHAAGRVFYGWYTARIGGSEIAGADGVMNAAWTYTANKSLYARWSTTIYTIEYRFINRYGKIINSIAGDYTNDNQGQFIVDELNITLKDAVFDEYVFIGWYNSSTIKDENEVNSITSVGNKILYGYIEQVYTISFDSNGGTSVSDIQGIAGQKITLPSPTKDKHIGTWKSWGYLTNDETISNFGYSYTIGTKDEEFEAVWKSLEYEITFDQNGGTGGTTSKDALVGEKMPSITLPSRTGYTFSGYYDEDTDKCYYTSSGTPMIFDQFKPVTLTARWSPKRWTLTIQTYIADTEIVDGSTVEMVYDQPHPTYGTQVTAPDIEGYTFVEWRKYYAYFQLNDESIYTSYTEKTVTIYNVLPATIYGDQIFFTAVYQPACIAEGTLITLADGSQKAVEDLTGDEMLLVWDLYTGTFGSAPILCIDSDPVGHYQVIQLSFSDGTAVDVISEHGFFDVDLNQYVYLDEYAAEYIGHAFWKQGENGMTAVTLVDVEISTEVTVAYSPVTYGHLCYYVNGMLSMPGGIGGLFNIFEIDAETMKYDAEAMAADIEQYGLYTYEELNALVPVPEVMFDAVNGQYLKVAVGKGIVTLEQIGELVERYSDLFS